MVPPLRSSPAAALLVGRDPLLSQLEALTETGTVRLLTLIGPAGIGKTALAWTLAERCAPRFADGAWIVRLGHVRDPELVPIEVARALRMRIDPVRPVRQQAIDHLRTRQALLVLDGFDQVGVAAAFVADLLSAAPQLLALATCRGPLHIHRERLVEVPPLALPPSDLPATAEALAHVPAVALFVHRARAANPRFEASAEQLATVADICAYVGGLPLAIELLAARSGDVTPTALLDRLQQREALLSHSSAGAPQSKHPLRGAIESSYELLEMPERTLFARLAVFVGGWTLGAAEAVCSRIDMQRGAFAGMAARPPLAEAFEPGNLDVQSALSSLVATGLVERHDGPDGEPRFAFSPTIRDYAAERLKASEHIYALQRQHAAYIVALAEEAEPLLNGGEQALWLRRIEREHDNVRAALQWALANNEIELALRVGGALWRFWYMQGHLGEGRRWLQRALARSRAQPAAIRAKALNGAGNLAYNQGDHTAAQLLHAESLVLRRGMDDRWGVAASLNNLGLIARAQNDYANARLLFTEALALNRQLNNQTWEAINLNNLGSVAADLGEADEARRLQEASLAIFREVGNSWGVAMALGDLGVALLLQGDDLAAERAIKDSLQRQRELGDQRNVAVSLERLAALAQRRGYLDEARALLADSLELRIALGDKRGIAECLERLAELELDRRGFEQAARLLAKASALRQGIGALQPPVQRERHAAMVAAIQCNLSGAVYNAAWHAGLDMSLDAVAAYATASHETAAPQSDVS